MKISSSTNEENSSTNEADSSTNEEKNHQIDSNDHKKQIRPPMKKIRSSTNEEIRPPQYTVDKITITDFDIQILKLAADQNHRRLIARTLNRSQGTIQYRLNRLEKAGLITPYQGTNRTKLYKISSKLTSLFIYNETKPPITPFTAHSMSFKFPILEGNQPKSSQAYKTATWTGYVFKSPDHTIRSTPSSIIIDINQDIGAASIDDLNLKYSQIAQSQVYKFAEKHHITLGGISKYREAHFTLEDNPLAQIISDRGEFKTASGLQIDKSRSSGDLEMKEESARAMEFTINKLPNITSELQTDVKVLTETLDSKLSGMEDNIDGIQKWLFLERENRQLREKNQIMEQSLNEIIKEMKEIKTMITQTENKQEGGMYG